MWLDDQKKPLWEAEPRELYDEKQSINVPREPQPGKPKYDETRGTWYVWPIDEDRDSPATLHVEGTTVGEKQRIFWRLVKPGGKGTEDAHVIERDTVQITVEPIVWPSNETESDWTGEPTTDWNGFELPAAWSIQKSLAQLINSPSDHSEIRTRYPEQTSEPSNVWKGNNYPPRASIDLRKALGLDASDPITNYRVVVHFSYEDAPATRSMNHYVDASNAQIKPGFFANSGVFVDGITEIQIFDTSSLNAAFGAGTTVTINGQNTPIKAVMDTADFNDPNKPNRQTGFTVDSNGNGEWVSLADQHVEIPDVNIWRAEKVAALITGIAYNEESARDNWADAGGAWVYVTSQGALVAKPGSMTIDVYRRSDGKSDIKVTCGDASYYYEAIQGTGGAKEAGTATEDTVELQSHWGSGVRFRQATVTAIPANEQEL